MCIIIWTKMFLCKFFTIGFGLASHLGVLVDIPSLGVAKKLFQVDGLEKNDEHKRKVITLKPFTCH